MKIVEHRALPGPNHYSPYPTVRLVIDLEDLAERTDVPEVGTFVNAIVQAEQLGTSVGRVLRSQAVMLRIRRRQKAEATARRAPIKMVFPLVLCIMPSFFIVTVGPIFVRFVDFLSK